MAAPWVVSGLWWAPGACLQKRERFRQACVITVAVPLADTRAGLRPLCHGCPLLDPSRPRCEAVAVPVTYWGQRGPWPGRRSAGPPSRTPPRHVAVTVLGSEPIWKPSSLVTLAASRGLPSWGRRIQKVRVAAGGPQRQGDTAARLHALLSLGCPSPAGPSCLVSESQRVRWLGFWSKFQPRQRSRPTSCVELSSLGIGRGLSPIGSAGPMLRLPCPVGSLGARAGPCGVPLPSGSQLYPSGDPIT